MFIENIRSITINETKCLVLIQFLKRIRQDIHTYPINGVFKLRKPFSFLLILFGGGCCCCSFFCCSKSCSCCWLSSICWNFKLPLLVSFSSFGSTNSSWDRLCLHQKYAAANKMSNKAMMPSVESTPINIMRPKSATNWLWNVSVYFQMKIILIVYVFPIFQRNFVA